MKLFIASSMKENLPQNILNETKLLLEEILKENDLVFGGYNEGIMGQAYKIALKNNREIIGICPKIYENDLNKLNCQKIPTNTLFEEINELINQSDAILILPGGLGTVFELFSSIEKKRSKEHQKEIIIYNINDYYTKLISFLDESIEKNFISKEDKLNYKVANDKESVIKYLNI